MPSQSVLEMHKAHQIVGSFDFDTVSLNGGYANRTLRIDLGTNDFSIQPVTQQMKDLWVGGKGFDLWLMFQEISKKTTWESPENPICFSSGPLGGTTSFPGSGKTLVTSISPLTNLVIDSNVGGYFGPFLKFTGFDALTIVGKANEDVIIFIDAVTKKVTIEKAPKESVDSHVVAEELTEMYADDELDMRNIAVVSAGHGAEHARMGILNFSFWDWRRGVARLKQAGRGGIGTVFRNKKVKAIVLKNRGITPAWRIEESKVARLVTPKTIAVQPCVNDKEKIESIIKKRGEKAANLMEMMLDIQKQFRHISKTAIELLCKHTGVATAKIYSIATFYTCFSLEPKGETVIEVCTGAACQAKGASRILDSFERVLGIKAGETTDDKKYTLEAASCLGACEIAPVVKINDELIGSVKAQNVEKLLSESKATSKKASDISIKVAGIDKPQVMREGDAELSTFKKLLNQDKKEEVVDIVKQSGLRGRGGGGVATGKKWQACLDAVKEKGQPAIVVCNSAIIEPSPYSVIEGMLIGAYAVGATEGIVSFRHEHLPVLERFTAVVDTLYDQGLLGKNILGSAFSFDLSLHRGAGGFVIGESSALLQTLSGSVGEPQAKFIHATESGLQGRPTLVNNIETWASIPLLFDKDEAQVTKVLSLSGAVTYSGLVEVSQDTTLRHIIEELGQGINSKKRTIKALHIGGPSGSFVPPSQLDTPVDYNSLKEAGMIMGASAIAVKDNRTCMVDAAHKQVQFLLEESCGKCTSCREGLAAADRIFSRIVAGHGGKEMIGQLKEVAQTMAKTSFCQFGKTAANPILSVLTHFEKECEAHVVDKTCPAGVCKELISFTINDNCTGCTVCAKNCPVNAISGERKTKHTLDSNICIQCGICLDSCNFDAVEVH